MKKSRLFVKRYRRAGIFFIILCLLFAACGACVSFIFPSKIAPEMGLVAGAIIGVVICAFPMSYCFVCMAVYGRRASFLSMRTGKITGFERGLTPLTVRLTVFTDGGEYQTAAIFFKKEAARFTGKKVSFCVISGTAFIDGYAN